jgi:membrane protein YqaA with SNARE-associated domain
MHSLSRWVLGVFASPLGVLVLAALDSTLFFSMPFGIDAVVIIVAARPGIMPWIVPLLATAGSVAGAALTFWMGTKIGEKGLDKWVPERRLERVRRKVKSSGAIALGVLDLIPPPFPFTPFVLAAGALEVDAKLFFVTLAVARLIRFGAESALAAVYGRSIVTWLESDLVETIVGACIVLAALLTAWSIVKIVRSTRTSGPRAALRARA